MRDELRTGKDNWKLPSALRTDSSIEDLATHLSRELEGVTVCLSVSY